MKVVAGFSDTQSQVTEERWGLAACRMLALSKLAILLTNAVLGSVRV
jgi:hypothetical protein